MVARKLRCLLVVEPLDEEDGDEEAVPVRRREIEQMLDELRRELYERLGEPRPPRTFSFAISFLIALALCMT